jgi:FkbM family methyltransferase
MFQDICNFACDMDHFAKSDKTEYIYSHLVDSESRMIFRHRMSYAISGDYRHIAKMARMCFLENQIRVRAESPSFFAFMEHRERIVAKFAPLAILGTDDAARRFFIKWAGRGADIVAFCGEEGDHFCSLPVMSAEETVRKFPDIFIKIPGENISSLQADTIRDFFSDRLLPSGIFTDNLRVNNGGEYFDSDIIKLGHHEIFADIGAKDMETSIIFGEMCGYRFEKIYAFEPDSRCHEICRENLCFFPKGSVDLLPLALSDKECDLPFFIHREPGNSKVCTDAVNCVTGVTLDSFLSGKPITFLKAHVEGNELNVLRGASETIRAHRPRIAVAVYHNPSDIVAIPDFILSLIPSYKLWLRHYSSGEPETVLYAV